MPIIDQEDININIVVFTTKNHHSRGEEFYNSFVAKY